MFLERGRCLGTAQDPLRRHVELAKSGNLAGNQIGVAGDVAIEQVSDVGDAGSGSKGTL